MTQKYSYYLPEIETAESARHFSSPFNSSQFLVEEAAKHFGELPESAILIWPLKFALLIDGVEVGVFEVEQELRPIYHAARID